MWGARFTELVDPSPFPLYTSPLVINTLHIPTLVIVTLHVHSMVIMVLHVLPMSIWTYDKNSQSAGCDNISSPYSKSSLNLYLM